eukprot:g58975.t1
MISVKQPAISSSAQPESFAGPRTADMLWQVVVLALATHLHFAEGGKSTQGGKSKQGGKSDVSENAFGKDGKDGKDGNDLSLLVERLGSPACSGSI